ncbi:hypothetical protein BH23GEM6_BH23GEM6_24830 [soil metagenome]
MLGALCDVGVDIAIDFRCGRLMSCEAAGFTIGNQSVIHRGPFE